MKVRICRLSRFPPIPITYLITTMEFTQMVQAIRQPTRITGQTFGWIGNDRRMLNFTMMVNNWASRKTVSLPYMAPGVEHTLKNLFR